MSSDGDLRVRLQHLEYLAQEADPAVLKDAMALLVGSVGIARSDELKTNAARAVSIRDQMDERMRVYRNSRNPDA